MLPQRKTLREKLSAILKKDIKISWEISLYKTHGDERISTGVLKHNKRVVVRYHYKNRKLKNKRQYNSIKGCLSAARLGWEYCGSAKGVDQQWTWMSEQARMTSRIRVYWVCKPVIRRTGEGMSKDWLHPEKVMWMDFRTRFRLPPSPPNKESHESVTFSFCIIHYSLPIIHYSFVLLRLFLMNNEKWIRFADE